MTYTDSAYVAMARMVTAYRVTAHVVMADIDRAYIALAYIVMAPGSSMYRCVSVRVWAGSDI